MLTAPMKRVRGVYGSVQGLMLAHRYRRRGVVRWRLWHRLLGGQCLSLADHVTVTAPTGEAVAAGCG